MQIIDKSLQVQVTNRQILKIALPISAAMLIPNINFITNSIFLGGLGERALGNAGTTGVFYLILMVCGNGLSNALQALISRSGGEGNIHAINKLLRISLPLVLQFAISLITWLIFFILLEKYGERAKAISNAMRNVFSLSGIFIWAFASTANTMVSNLIGQGLHNLVEPAINKIVRLSVISGITILSVVNIFPQYFLQLFGQDAAFVHDAIPVVRIISLGMGVMSFATIWLNAVTGTGKTKMNLQIELVAIIFYLAYIYLVMIRLRSSLSVAWANEMLYWFVIFSLSFRFIKSGRWKTEKVS